MNWVVLLYDRTERGRMYLAQKVNYVHATCYIVVIVKKGSN